MATSFTDRKTLKVKLAFEQKPAQGIRNPKAPPQWPLMRLTHLSTLVFLSVKLELLLSAKKSSLGSFPIDEVSVVILRNPGYLQVCTPYEVMISTLNDTSMPDCACVKLWGIWQAAYFSDGCFERHCLVFVVKQHMLKASRHQCKASIPVAITVLLQDVKDSPRWCFPLWSPAVSKSMGGQE